MRAKRCKRKFSETRATPATRRAFCFLLRSKILSGLYGSICITQRAHAPPLLVSKIKINIKWSINELFARRWNRAEINGVPQTRHHMATANRLPKQLLELRWLDVLPLLPPHRRALDCLRDKSTKPEAVQWWKWKSCEWNSKRVC